MTEHARLPTHASLLDLDPDLGLGLAGPEWEAARHATPADVVRIRSGGGWLPQTVAERADVVGLVVIEGVLAREVALGQHHMLELLCPADALLPPVSSPALPRLGAGTRITAISDSLLAVLSTPFLRAAARWPALATSVMHRVEIQRERLAMQGLVAHLPRAEDRILLTLWLLAESCGRVTSAGTVLPLTLTHETLGRLAAARRPTVTLALHRLESEAIVHRTERDQLALTAGAERRISELVASGTSKALASRIVLTGLRSVAAD